MERTGAFYLFKDKEWSVIYEIVLQWIFFEDKN